LILDSSAVVAVLRREWGHERIERAMEDAGTLTIGAPTLFETAMVAVGRFGRDGQVLVEHFLEAWGVHVAPFDHRHWRVAVAAFNRYGKGRGHPARLNYGDCMTYATARLAEMPLLFVGDDFAKTDIAVA
jgi:ribonuclease VapC